MLIITVDQIVKSQIFKMAAGSHIGFWPPTKLAHTFARVTLANFFHKPSKTTNPLRNEPSHSTVTGSLQMTQLRHFLLFICRQLEHSCHFM